MKIKGYDALDADCPRRPCWAPGTYYARGATCSGSRNTGAGMKCCLRRANHGCPAPLPEPLTRASALSRS